MASLDAERNFLDTGDKLLKERLKILKTSNSDQHQTVENLIRPPTV